MKNDKTLREAIRAILSEAWRDDGLPDEADRSRMQRGTKNVEFTVYLPDDSEVSVHAIYNERTPFEVELWKAEDLAGREVDLDELRAVVPNLEDQAWHAIEQMYA